MMDWMERGIGSVYVQLSWPFCKETTFILIIQMS